MKYEDMRREVKHKSIVSISKVSSGYMYKSPKICRRMREGYSRENYFLEYKSNYISNSKIRRYYT